MKIGVLSDLYIKNLGALPQPADQPDVLVLAGNIGAGLDGFEWAAKTYDCPIVYVLGNHSYWDRDIETFDDEVRSMAWGTNVHFLQNETLVIRGVRFIGSTLWTDFGLFGDTQAAMRLARETSSDYRRIRNGRGEFVTPDDIYLRHQQAVEYLRRTATQPYDEGHTVVVTHHAPSLRSVPSAYQQDGMSACFASHLDWLVSEADAMLWIHAGEHECVDYLIGTTRLVANPRGCADGAGLRPVERFRADYVVNI